MNQLCFSSPLAVGKTILIPVECVALRVERHRYGHWFSASKQVVAMIVCEPGRLRAIDVQARELPVDTFISTIPGLAEIIEKCNAG